MASGRVKTSSDQSVELKVRRFFGRYPLRQCPKGQILIHAGVEPAGVFYLAEGTVRQYDISPSGVEIVVNVFQPPAYFSMSWAINKTPVRYFFETASQVSYRQAPAGETVAFIKANPDVMFDLLSRVYSGTDGLLRRTAHLMSSGARKRLLFELINTTRRFGHPYDTAAYSLEIQESDLAKLAGLARETVSRELQKLKKAGLVQIRRNNLLVKDLKALEKLLGDNL